MPKAKIARKSTTPDMTPMCDVAFLLLTFFMLTTKFKPKEPVKVVTPSSIATELLPQKDVAMVTIGKKGRVFYGISNQNERVKLIKAVSKSYKLNLSPIQIKHYSEASTVGMPINQIGQFLNISALKVAQFKQPGIPIDSAKGELRQWITYTQSVDPNPGQIKYVIKADNSTKYKVIRRVIDIFKDLDINQLHLITSMAKAPAGTPAFKTEHSTVKSNS